MIEQVRSYRFTIKQIFNEHWENYLSQHKDSLRQDVIWTIKDFRISILLFREVGFSSILSMAGSKKMLYLASQVYLTFPNPIWASFLRSLTKYISESTAHSLRIIFRWLSPCIG